MRKRVWIGVVAFLFIGVSAYVFSGFHPDTIDYHSKAYLKDNDWGHRELWILNNAPRRIGTIMLRMKQSRVEDHRKALIRHGYLGETAIVVSNISAFDAMVKALGALETNLHRMDEDFLHWYVVSPATNVVHLVAKRGEVQIWQELIRQADVAQTGQ